MSISKEEASYYASKFKIEDKGIDSSQELWYHNIPRKHWERYKEENNIIEKETKPIFKEEEIDDFKPASAKEILLDEKDTDKRKKEREFRLLEEEKKIIKERFLEKVHDKKFGEASEVIVDFIKTNYYIYTTKDDNKSEMWIYKEGIYVPQGKSEVKIIMRDLLGVWFNTYYYNLVMNKLEPDTSIDQDEFFGHNYADEIPVLNGILNIRTRQLYDFTPDKIFFNKLPVKYDPVATCPQIDKFLSDVLSHEEDRKVFYEIAGFALLKEYKFEKGFMMVGDGRNGKDKSLELLKRLLGVENCCSVPLASIIPDSFIISEFHNKMANLAGEISNHDLKDTSMFKALTGRSLLSAPRKFLQPITFVNHAKFIFACNELPMVYDNSRGFWDRWVVLEFPYTFVPKEELESNPDNFNLKLRDESIIDKITTSDEMSGFLNKSIEGLHRLLEKKRFSDTKGSDEIKKLWVRKSNSVMAFVLDKVEEEYDSFITKKDFRKQYTDYCKEHKVPSKSDYVIKRTLEEAFGASEGTRDILGRTERIWEGIKWKI